MTKIKICGLTRLDDIDVVNQLNPDYIGFIFAKSRRQVSVDQSILLKNKLSTDIKSVGVFVNEEICKIIDLCKTNVIDIVQLHGDEDETYIKILKDNISNKIIKAVRVKTKDDIIKNSIVSSDFLLFDAYHEHHYGGSGSSFDWNLLKNFNKPYYLAGGITEYNVLQAIQLCNPYCIDVSSGVETDGLKDKQKIKKLVDLVRSVN